MNHTGSTHDSAPTQFLDLDGVQIAYRSIGKGPGTPVVFLQHFRGNLDNHDPAITDGLAVDREVLLFNQPGIASSGGSAKETVDDMADDAHRVIEQLGRGQVDLVGHSMGGQVAQLVALKHPEFVRRLILVGTGPRGGVGAMASKTVELFQRTYDRQDEMWLPIMFSPSPDSQAAGWRWLERIRSRQDRDSVVSESAQAAHWAGAQAWGSAPNNDDWAYLRSIKQPTLIVNGSNDIVIATENSFLMQQRIPNSYLELYPDSNHGSHFQYHQLFVDRARSFLDG